MTADERCGVSLDIICARRYETIDNLAFELDASRAGCGYVMCTVTQNAHISFSLVESIEKLIYM